MDTPLLWHIPLSHFNEKVRWTLDYKRIPHRRRVLGADYLIRAWRATGRGTLPILFLDGRAIGDSTQIIAALEERYPEPPLYPGDAAARQRALALEDYFDEQLGPALRAAMLTPLFRHDPDLALRVLTTGMRQSSRELLRHPEWSKPDRATSAYVEVPAMGGDEGCLLELPFSARSCCFTTSK
jgi:glutathione S-transferase